ncbi:heme-binding protein, partial [Singulisphaera rosea]
MFTRRSESPGFLACLLAITTVCGIVDSDARAQEGLGKASSIHDRARMFSAQAVEKAETQLLNAKQQSRVPTYIETIESLGVRSIEEVSLKNSERFKGKAVYVLLAKDEHKIEVRVSEEARSAVGEVPQREIRDAFIRGLRTGDADNGLRIGVEAIVGILAKVQATPAVTEKDWGFSHPSDGSPFVVRNQVRLTLAGARTVIVAAEKKAVEMGLKVNIALVDDGGHLIAFERMDGARPASVATAITKATSAATYRQETGPIPK